MSGTEDASGRYAAIENWSTPELTVGIIESQLAGVAAVLPAAGARNIANNVKQYHLFSVLIAMFSGFFGLMLAYYFDMAAGATIVVISSVLFFLTLLLKPYFSR